MKAQAIGGRIVRKGLGGKRQVIERPKTEKVAVDSLASRTYSQKF
jgi:hypothetical protein